MFKETAISSVFEHVTKPTLIIAGEHGERITTLESKEVADLVKESQFDCMLNQVYILLRKRKISLLKM